MWEHIFWCYGKSIAHNTILIAAQGWGCNWNRFLDTEKETRRQMRQLYYYRQIRQTDINETLLYDLKSLLDSNTQHQQQGKITDTFSLIFLFNVLLQFAMLTSYYTFL
jgi:Rps23 Pro-64 3,4-dihydroxylase Tpa1-like proline 4-hydroxylase